jgi:hypothetical protein
MDILVKEIGSISMLWAAIAAVQPQRVLLDTSNALLARSSSGDGRDDERNGSKRVTF